MSGQMWYSEHTGEVYILYIGADGKLHNMYYNNKELWEGGMYDEQIKELLEGSTCITENIGEILLKVAKEVYDESLSK